MKHFLVFLVCVYCFNQGFSQNKSRVEFVIRNVGIGVDGYFEAINIETDFDAEGKLLKIKGVIKTNSIKTGINSRDEHLLKEDYFNVENHENITLLSKTIKSKSDGTFIVVATLTIKGIIKDIRIIVNLEKVDNQYKMTSNFEINRRDFDIGGKSLVLSNTVKIKVLHFHKL